MKNAENRRRSFSPSANKSRAGLIILSAAMAALTSKSAYGVTGTWSGAAADGNWATAGNWDVVPGLNNGSTNSPDVADFNNGATTLPITVDLNRNVFGVTFDTANAGIFQIGSAGVDLGNPLLLTNGGNIQITSTVVATGSETINSPLILEGTSYSFIDNAALETTGPLAPGLQMSGNVSGGSASPTTLILDGSNSNTSGSTSNNQINGNISNGASSSLSILMQGTGVWELHGTNNTYTGTTTVTNGVLRVTTTGGFSPATDIILNSTTAANGYVSLGAPTPFPTVHSLDDLITANSGKFSANVVTESGGGLNIANNTGPALTFDVTNMPSTTADPKFGGNILLTGTVADQGGVTLLTSPNSPKISDNKGIDLGSVSRIFNIGHGGTNIAGQTTGGNSTDLQLNGVIAGAGSLIKTGSGNLKLQNTAETFTGTLEIQGGQVKAIGNGSGGAANTLIGTNPLLIDGGQLSLNGANLTFGPATFTAGSTQLSTTSPGAGTFLIAPSYTFSVPSAGTFTMGNLMTDDGSPSAVLSNGAGIVTIQTDTVTGLNQNNYTGGTTITNGTFNFSTPGAMPVNAVIANSGAMIVGGASTASSVTGTGTTTVNATISFVANAFTQGALVNNGITQINGNGTVGPVSGTGSLTIGTGSAANTLKLANGSGLSVQNSLTVNALSTLDVSNNHMIINYGANPDPAATIYGYLKSGYNGGAWTGAGIDSSTAALPANNANYGVGFVDGAAGVPGATVTSGQILIAYALYGDVNLDGLVNATDFAVFGANFNSAVTGWERGDFTYTGLINATDFALLGANFGKSASGAAVSLPASDFAALDAFAAANNLSLPSVPEPASLGLLALGAMGILGRRRRRS